MKITRRGIDRLVGILIRETLTVDDVEAGVAPMTGILGALKGEADSADEELDEDEKHPEETLDTSVMGKGMLYKGKKMKTPSQLSYGLDYTGTGMGESLKITRKQLRSIIKEVIDRGPDFPDLSHPTIAQFADKTYGPTEPMGGAKWFTSMQSYRYKAGGSSDQSITVYHLPDGQYRARIGGSYSNTLSNDRRAGKHPDAISAIEAALDSSPSSSGPTARELLKRVGEKVKSSGYIGQD